MFNGLKKNKKITPANIPAATQLFTPHWIVRYLVENSLGRLWLLNRPDSKLAEQMDYYIKPEQSEADFLRISKPEEIKICDPASGSGHMLTYAFDLLYAIYEEEGYDPGEIPTKILTHNLYGIEIDERAGELAAFALTMKARAKQRRFFNKGIKPNICVLENVRFDEDELTNYMDFVGRDLFTVPLQTTLRQFEEADNFGSLIRPDVIDVDGMRGILEAKDVSAHLFLNMIHQKVLSALGQADYLSPKYHVVIANPPYLGSKGMNGRLAKWAKENYPNSKSDLFAMFIERSLDLARTRGMVAMITMQSWMFLSSYRNLRGVIAGHGTILSMAHLGARAFDSIGGEVVSTTSFVLRNTSDIAYEGDFLRLVDGDSEAEKERQLLRAIGDRDCGWIYSSSSSDFTKIPGGPIAYWVGEKLLAAFKEEKLRDVADARQGMATSDNERFLRLWHEVDFENTCFQCKSSSESERRDEKWYAYNKGGSFRRWYGNNEHVVNWHKNGQELKGFVEELNKIRPGGRLKNQEYYFLENITYSALSSGLFSARYNSAGCLFDTKGSCIFPRKITIGNLMSFLNSKVAQECLNILCPTLDYSSIGINAVPVVRLVDRVESKMLIRIGRVDWDANETSWDFVSLPLLNPNYRQLSLVATYQKVRAHWWEITLEMQRLEEENNRIFIEAYGLQDELKPEVKLNEITLTCNPHYRYGVDKSKDELESLLLADTMRELVSYAVGCMFGRYALDKPGLILANQGETLDDYLKRIPKPSFLADDDNVIPMLNGDWFTDDISERFKEFLKVAFGSEHYEENIQFVEESLNIKGKRNYSIRDYFLKEFYADHVKRYKKRPIYWLFSSPKGSFNALIYMHRYRPDTVSVVLNDYLREFRTKLASHKDNLEAVSISASNSQSEKTKALKEIEKITKMIAEMEEYEREVLYPLAARQVEIDLDDGVKVNYPKLGGALKKVVGLVSKEK